MKPICRAVLRAAAVAIVGLAVTFALLSDAAARTIIDEWATVKPPPPAELKPVTVDVKDTALLLLDFAKQNCGQRPRCVASVPKVQELADKARAKNMAVVHSLFGQVAVDDLLIAPAPGEPNVRSVANKFVRTDLAKILEDKGIKTVIIAGTSAHGAVLNTASMAAFLGFKVIVPVDGVSSDLYTEQYTAWHLANAPGIGANVTLTRLDLIRF